MNCPKCGFSKTKVIDSRESGNAQVRRRRDCGECGYRFTTYELLKHSYTNKHMGLENLKADINEAIIKYVDVENPLSF